MDLASRQILGNPRVVSVQHKTLTNMWKHHEMQGLWTINDIKLVFQYKNPGIYQTNLTPN